MHPPSVLALLLGPNSQYLGHSWIFSGTVPLNMVFLPLYHLKFGSCTINKPAEDQGQVLQDLVFLYREKTNDILGLDRSLNITPSRSDLVILKV